MYSIVITTKDGTNLGEIINFNSLKFSKRLNDYGSCEIKFSLFEPKLESLISLRNYEVKILRNSTVVWAGEQAYLTVDVRRRNAETVNLQCFDYFEQFNARYTGAVDSYPGIDAGQIAWTLIDDSQNLTDGDFGVTQGTINTTINRDRTYYNQNIYEAIINLSNVENGFDFEITDNKVFNVYSLKGIDRSSTISFEYAKNMNNIIFESDFSRPANEVIALGEGFAEEQLRETFVNTSARSVHKLRQGLVSDPQITDTANLQDKAEEAVRKFSVPIDNIRFIQVQDTDPLFGTLALGDIVRVRVQRGIIDIDSNYRIYAYNVNLDSKGRETVQYLISQFI